MKKVVLLAVALGVAILFCPGLAPPAQAGTFTCNLTEGSPQSTLASNPCGTNPDGTNAASYVLSGEGYWHFDVTVVGRVSFLGMQIKNNPGAGDICFVFGSRQPTNTFSVTTPSVIEEAHLNACGTQFRDTNGNPLTLFAYIQTADPGASVKVKVTYPDCSATDPNSNPPGACTTENGFTLNRMGPQQRTLAKLRDQGNALPQWTDPVVDESKRRVLLG